MTTIAWDGTTLAGDSLGVIGNSLRVKSQKLFRLDDGRLFGGSGRYDDVLAVSEWLDDEDREEPPKVEDFAGIVVTPSGECYRIEESLVLMPIFERCHAVGSGRDFAIAAMALGKTAAEAVEFAKQFDVWTGGDVRTLCLDGGIDNQYEWPPRYSIAVRMRARNGTV